MATHTQTPSVTLQQAPITSAQPGGGLCMSIELAWGRFRRSFLRRFRPSYVKAIQARRQGTCANCPHDIIDSRDLKFQRPVCGYSFRPEDDAFAWRGRLQLARYGLAELILFSLLLGIIAAPLIALAVWVHSAWWAAVFVPFATWLFIVSFFRDPEREIPKDTDALISPADGTITDIGEVEEADFPSGRAYRVGIFLSVFNVHVNRIPRSGRVLGLRYFPGKFLDARTTECQIVNEQLWLDLGLNAPGQFARIKQIAGLAARRIVCWLKAGEEVRAGERYGMIKFGSRTEVYLPATLVKEVLIKVGDTVQGGKTILLRLHDEIA